MKVKAILLIIIIVAGILGLIAGQMLRDKGYEIVISGSTSVLPLMQLWSQEFTKTHTDYRIDVSGGGSGKGIRDVAAGIVDIGMHSRPYMPGKDPDFNRLTFSVANDGVLVCVNRESRIVGVTREFLQAVWGYGEPLPEYPVKTHILIKENDGLKLVEVTVSVADKTTHKVLIAGENFKYYLQPYTRAEASGTAETFASFLVGGEGKQSGLRGKTASGNQGMAYAVSTDPDGIAYIAKAFFNPDKMRCLLIIVVEDNKWSVWNNYQYDENNVPTDHAIALGAAGHAIIKTPGAVPGGYPISRELYVSVNLDKYGGKLPGYLAEFLKWCFTEGQDLVEKVHYVRLLEEQQEENLDKLLAGSS